MNSRIIELYDEAQYRAGSKKTWNTTNLDVAEELVRLVVEECIQLCDQVDLVGADDCIDNIKQHFGVEE